MPDEPSRLGPQYSEDNELLVGAVDTCAICHDGECDGISCVSDLDADDPDDHPAIEELQRLVRAGQVFLGAREVHDRTEGLR